MSHNRPLPDEQDGFRSLDKTSWQQEVNNSHGRNVSAYSMDSFVAELQPGEGDADDTSDDEPASPPRTKAVLSSNHYLSPSSSTTASDRDNTDHPMRPILPPARDDSNHKHETIEPLRKHSGSDLGAGSGSESAAYVDPQHPFFGSSYYEDDVSEGSLVFNNSSQQEAPVMPFQYPSPSHARRQRGDKRDRFPSFDSVGSTSSIRYVPPGSQIYPQPMPPAQAPSSSKPKIMPYHERLQQRRQQQQGSTGTQPIPPRPERQTMPYFTGSQPNQGESPMYQPYPQQPPPYPHQPPYPGVAPPHPYPSPQQAYQPPYPYAGGIPAPPVQGGYPLPTQGNSPLYPPLPSFQQQQGARPSSHRTNDKAAEGNRPPSAATKTGGRARGYQRPPMSRQSSNPQSTPAYRHSHSSSLDDSSDGVEREPSSDPPRPQASSKDVPPPPPPPPLPPNYAHVRQDSSGSVSSLGSMDRSGREENDGEDRRVSTEKKKNGENNGKGGFFGRLNPWAKKEPDVNDFHRKNQAFLQSSTVKRHNSLLNSPSPTQQVRRVPLGAMDRPPASRGTHKRLPSIDNDNWEEEAKDGTSDSPRPSSEEEDTSPETKLQQSWKSMRRKQSRSARNGDDDSYSAMSLSDGSDYEAESELNMPNEKTRLLPPTGISSNEHMEKSYTEEHRRRRHRPPRSGSRQSRHSQTSSPDAVESEATARMDNTTAMLDYKIEKAKRKHKKKKRHKNRSRKSRHASHGDSSGTSVSSTSSSSQDYQRWLRKRAKLLEQERALLIKQWREEAKAEEEAARREAENNRWQRRLGRFLESEFGGFMDRSFKFFTWAEAFIANLPLTIGAIALASATLGVDWFKFAEENMDSCEPVHFHSSQCTFPEFPGCFYCDTNARMYKVAVNFHFACSIFAGILAVSFIAKLILARRVVFDELSSPTTASPAGLTCMALDVVFAGRGLVGQIVVSAASGIHLCLAIWFIYMALAYHIMPEPSWFPNTVGIGISAVKTWLYFPMMGHFLMAISLSLNLFFFPISLIRVFMNRKISATVGWMQMSAPNVSLYALTIMAQPSFAEEHPDITQFQRVHRMIYLPCMHFLFALCILGISASVVSLVVRWKEFRKFPFSPAHAAFCCPTLSHANAIQAYRAALNSFSDIPPGSPFKICLYTYWLIVLLGGTIATLWIGAKFLCSLPEWTHIDTEGEIEPPAPYETSMTLSNMISTGETLVQPFVSPAILQANETGALVLARSDTGQQRYVRTRKVTALGFEPIMNVIEMERERELLLDWVGKNPPRRRHRTLSVPGIDFSYGASLGTGNSGIYGMEEGSTSSWPRRPRASTGSPYVGTGRKNVPSPS